ADEAMLFYAVEVDPGTPDWDESVGKALRMLKARLSTAKWERPALNDTIKEVVKSSGLKMPQLAMPLRRLVTGRSQTPSIDAVRDSGADYKFDIACTGRVPIHGSGTVRYTPTTLDGEVDLIGETQGLRLKTRSFVSGRRLGPCNN